MNAIADTHKYGMWDRLRLPPRDLAEFGLPTVPVQGDSGDA